MSTEDAVRRFVIHAVNVAGSSDKLAQAMEPHYQVESGTIRGWTREKDRNKPRAEALFAMALAFPKELSIDEFIHGDRESLYQSVIKIQRQISYLVSRFDELLADQGKPPLDMP